MEVNLHIYGCGKGCKVRDTQAPNEPCKPHDRGWVYMQTQTHKVKTHCEHCGHLILDK